MKEVNLKSTLLELVKTGELLVKCHKCNFLLSEEEYKESCCNICGKVDLSKVEYSLISIKS